MDQLRRRRQGLDQEAGRLDGEAGEVEYRVRLEPGDPITEGPVLIFLLAIGGDHPDAVPGVVGGVRAPTAATDHRDLVPGPDQARHQERPDMTGPTDDHDAHGASLRPASPGASGGSDNVSLVWSPAGPSSFCGSAHVLRP